MRVGIRGCGSSIKRFYSDKSFNKIVDNELNFKDHRIYLYAFPITNKKTFINCKFDNRVFPNETPTLEYKITGKFSKMWHDFSTNERSINQKITHGINSVLAKIPWLETCLLSLPGEKFITRKEKGTGRYLEYGEIQEKNISSDDMEKIDFYYPKKITNLDRMLSELKPEFKSQYDSHKKGILKDMLLMPLTIPIALIPLIPNIPGFFLLYRIYCHIKVIGALKYLVLLLKDGHLKYNEIENDRIAEIYLKSNDDIVRLNVIEHLEKIGDGEMDTEVDEEKLLISEDIAQELCSAFGDPDSYEKLLFAIGQERKNIMQHREKSE